MIYDFPSQYTNSTWNGVSSIQITSNNTPLNLNDCQIFIKVRSFFNLASPTVCEFSNKDNTIIVENASQGIIKIPPQNIEIPEGKYKYSLKIIFPSKTEKTYMTGSWDILPSVSRVPISTRIPILTSPNPGSEIGFSPTYQFTYTPYVTADTDYDGYTNISELSAGTDPNDTSDFPLSLFNVFNDI